MFTPTEIFSGFSVNHTEETRAFYEDTLGLEVTVMGYGGYIELLNGAQVFFYPKGEAHTPATYTILNFTVDDIDLAHDELTKRGVTFDSNTYTDERGIQRGINAGRGPDQAWFKDPSGNILSILKQP
jgi:catechol 2,3-dioxygenase-like lactoylglutathione lyase family enzyme